MSIWIKVCPLRHSRVYNETIEIMEEFEKTFAKQQSDQQRIDQEGVRIFESSLPSTDKLSVPFNEQGSNDFGIDGEIQVLTDKYVTGEKYKVQIKSSEHIKYIHGGKKVSFSLDIRSAYSLVKIEKVPTALIVVDVVQKKVFWLAIQIDKTVQESLEKKLSKPDKEILKDKSVTVHIDVEQQLSPNNFSSMHDELKASALQLAENKIVATKEKSLITGIKNLQAIEDRILELEGFIPQIRNQNDTPAQRTIMSISHGSSKSIDYVPGPDFRPELAPVIQVKANFNIEHEEDKKLAESFRSMLNGKAGSITIPRKNIELFTAKSGTTLIDSLEKDGDLMITISPNIEKRSQTFILRSRGEELQVKTQSWVSDGAVHIESIESEPLQLSISMPVPASGVMPSEGIDVQAHVEVNDDAFINASHELRVMNFVRGAESLEMYFLGPDGFRNKFMDAKKFNEALGITDEFYDLVLKMVEIEAKTGCQIRYPIPKRITASDVAVIRRTHAQLYDKDELDSADFTLTPNSEKVKLPTTGDVVVIQQNPAFFTLFDENYELSGYEKRFTGLLSKLKRASINSKMYKLQIKKVEVRMVSSSARPRTTGRKNN